MNMQVLHVTFQLPVVQESLQLDILIFLFNVFYKLNKRVYRLGFKPKLGFIG